VGGVAGPVRVAGADRRLQLQKVLLKHRNSDAHMNAYVTELQGHLTIYLEVPTVYKGECVRQKRLVGPPATQYILHFPTLL
jgi:hypothetical protein